VWRWLPVLTTPVPPGAGLCPSDRYLRFQAEAAIRRWSRDWQRIVLEMALREALPHLSDHHPGAMVIFAQSKILIGMAG